MEDGIQTKVGSSGVRLSGGQAQRLALARTLKFKRPVLILDDPFSALDKPTDCLLYTSFTGRTLFGARPAKGQEMDDQFYGALKARVSDFMRDLDEELWKIGVFARTEHNEVAPAQHELAPVFTDVNVAADHNQLTICLLYTSRCV